MPRRQVTDDLVHHGKRPHTGGVCNVGDPERRHALAAERDGILV